MAGVYSVILAGGLGSRLWPLSRASYPKQIFKLNDEYTLFQQTFLRLASVVDDKNILTTANIKHSSAIKEQLKILQEKFCRKSEYKMLTEPIFKNTAAALVLAVKYIEYTNKDNVIEPVIIAVPCDHYIPDRIKFANLIEKGIKLAKAGYIVSFSQLTDKIDENFGYIKARRNSSLEEIDNDALKVTSFIEKPISNEDKKKLKGKFYINTGIYIFSVKTFLEEMKKSAPGILNIFKNEKIDTTIPSVPLSTYNESEDISIDYALMEKTKKLVTIPFETDWKDIGSWDAIYEISPKDKNKNCIIGRVIDINSENSLIYSTSKTVATMGLKDTAVIETEDAILVCGKNNIKGIKKIYNKLNGKNTTAKDIHKTVFRPWGCYSVLEEGSGFLTKCIIVNPNAKLSVQLHHHRSEHWIILEGKAHILKGNKFYDLEAGQSIDIGIEEIHSLQNLSNEQLKVLEVQQGDILDESDIERIEDIYGRV